jgi:hypothetical protein
MLLWSGFHAEEESLRCSTATQLKQRERKMEQGSARPVVENEEGWGSDSARTR